jgi:hypothetical protein
MEVMPKYQANTYGSNANLTKTEVSRCGKIYI